MSPNIIKIRHIEGLTQSFIHELFSGIDFHKISPPLTSNGVWRLYVASRGHYLQLLSRPYVFGNSIFEEGPNCLKLALTTSLACFKSEQKISPSQIYIYNRSAKLTTSEQIVEAIPEISDVHISKSSYENGNLFIFNIYDRSMFLKILHLNGSSLNGTIAYLMTYGDDITINNMSSNILVAPNCAYPSNPLEKTIADTIKTASTQAKLIHPKNLKEFKTMINHGINCINTYKLDFGYHFYPQQFK
ncbi:hypothetical protein RF11_10241 [Thelohanellus kitauei]|uniref:Uncharacterized protein n=1 Tax=Thelohanellus kitauei TaxID=669202 RepID=A0A0C2J603_THEKT|nr:hypothetical protein RF11_10241 [Thelohanellus kitauei]